MIYAILVLISGLSISAVAAYYSIVGLTTIFSGSVFAIAVMGAVLEIGKLVAASWLKQNWQVAGHLMKSYLVTAVIVLMFITSMGIFGYLSKAHLEQTSGISNNQSKIEKIEFNITQQEKKIQRSQANLERSQNMVDQLDSALKVYVDNQYVTKALKERAKQKEERERLKQEQKEYELEIEVATEKIGDLNEKKFKFQQEVQEIEVEVGPIKYIADLVYGEEQAENMLNDAVRAVILVLIFVFDPLAVLLLLAANISFSQAFKKRKEKKENLIKSKTIKPTISENITKEDSSSNLLKDWIPAATEAYKVNNETKKEKNKAEVTKELSKDKLVKETKDNPLPEDFFEECEYENKKTEEDLAKEEKEKRKLDWQDKLLEENEHVSLLTKEDMLSSVEKSFQQAKEKASIPFNLNSPEGEELKKIIVNNLQKEYK